MPLTATTATSRRCSADEVMRSCGLVAQTLMLAARAKGLDSVPMDGFDFAAMH